MSRDNPSQSTGSETVKKPESLAPEVQGFSVSKLGRTETDIQGSSGRSRKNCNCVVSLGQMAIKEGEAVDIGTHTAIEKGLAPEKTALAKMRTIGAQGGTKKRI